MAPACRRRSWSPFSAVGPSWRKKNAGRLDVVLRQRHNLSKLWLCPNFLADPPVSPYHRIALWQAFAPLVLFGLAALLFRKAVRLFGAAFAKSRTDGCSPSAKAGNAPTCRVPPTGRNFSLGGTAPGRLAPMAKEITIFNCTDKRKNVV